MRNDNLREYFARVANKYISIVIVMLIILGIIFIPPFAQKIRLQVNREKWESQNITHYRFDLNIGCFCPIFWGKMPVTVEVKEGEIISMVDGNGFPLDESFSKEIEDTGTIENMFELIQKGISDAFSVGISYDSKYGFPVSIEFDWDRRIVDDESTYEITNFEILP